jgi:D-alanyl-D-alanine dipeptidase
VREVVLMSDPRVTSIPVRECGDPLVAVRPGPGLLLDGPAAETAGPGSLLRPAVRDRLLAAAARLPAGLRLALVEGYRPPGVQRAQFHGYAASLAQANPGWTPEEVHTAASRYLSPPDIAPHAAGAAVDVALVDGTGTHVDVGCPLNATPEESAGACYTDSPLVTGAALGARRVLADALTAAGLVNYPTEWWHWSYGDRYWAMVTGAPAALFGILQAGTDTGAAAASHSLADGYLT